MAAVVLAAGEGKRLKTELAKVLHRAAGRALIDHVLAALEPLAPDPLVVVVGHLRDQVLRHLEGRAIATVVQDPPRGTADAVLQALPALPSTGELLVLSGDVPLITTETLKRLVAARRNEGASVAVATAVLPDGGGYGRVVRGGDGRLKKIVEARDASDEQLALGEVNAGGYAFDIAALREVLPEVGAGNAQGEFYLTDAVGLLALGGGAIPVVLDESAEMAGVNARSDLAEVHRLLSRRVVEGLMRDGVTVLDPPSTWIEAGCAVGRETVLEPGVHLRDACVIGEGCLIGAHSVLEGVTLPPGTTIPPLTHRKDR